jgi:hypothetical protein
MAKRFPIPLGAPQESFIWQEYVYKEQEESVSFERKVETNNLLISRNLPNIAVNGFAYAGGGDAEASVFFLSNGIVEATTNNAGTYFVASWYSPTTTGIGNSFWIRYTLLAGTSPTGAALNTWLPLDTTSTLGITQDVDGTTTTVISYEISPDFGGSVVLGSGRISLSATKNSTLIEP